MRRGRGAQLFVKTGDGGVGVGDALSRTQRRLFQCCGGRGRGRISSRSLLPLRFRLGSCCSFSSCGTLRGNKDLCKLCGRFNLGCLSLLLSGSRSSKLRAQRFKRRCNG